MPCRLTGGCHRANTSGHDPFTSAASTRGSAPAVSATTTSICSFGRAHTARPDVSVARIRRSRHLWLEIECDHPAGAGVMQRGAESGTIRWRSTLVNHEPGRAPRSRPPAPRPPPAAGGGSAAGRHRQHRPAYWPRDLARISRVTPGSSSMSATSATISSGTVLIGSTLPTAPNSSPASSSARTVSPVSSASPVMIRLPTDGRPALPIHRTDAAAGLPSRRVRTGQGRQPSAGRRRIASSSADPAAGAASSATVTIAVSRSVSRRNAPMRRPGRAPASATPRAAHVIPCQIPVYDLGIDTVACSSVPIRSAMVTDRCLPRYSRSPASGSGALR